MKILIISALPFDTSSSTRAFKTYFKNISKKDIAQIYTNPSFPTDEYCSNFYQITDSRMMKKYLGRKSDSGLVINQFSEKHTNNIKKHSYSFLKKDYGFIHLIRDRVWKEQNWFTKNLINWIKAFKPDCVFYHNSNSIFISKIALKISDYFRLPLVVEVSDDYYFNKKKSCFLFENIYRKKYRNVFEKIMSRANGCFYISERMKEKYKSFSIQNSDYVHIASENILNNTNQFINKTFCYFGNTGFQRDKTIVLFSKRIGFLFPESKIDVYSPLLGNSGHENMKKQKNINLCGFLPYEQLLKEIVKYEYILIAEPYRDKVADYIGLSLSTKVGDSLAFGKKMICLGNPNCGTIDYLKTKDCGLVLDCVNKVKNLAKEDLIDADWDRYINNAIHCFKTDFSIEKNSNKAFNILNKAIEEYGKKAND